jgi:predicted esterase
LALLAAVAVMSAGAASAQTVASTGHAGLDPASGKAPTQAVIMFHGFGQKGENMKPVADDLAKRLPNAVFIFDNAPATQGTGFSWYNLRADDPEGRAKAKGIATDTVKKVQDTWKIKPENIVAVGFSQGGGIALDAGLCSTPNVKAVVSLAGVLEQACDKAKGAKDTNILIVRNDEDPLVKEERIVAFEDAVKKAGYSSKRETVAGKEHWPSPDGIKKAEDFVVAQLGGK